MQGDMLPPGPMASFATDGAFLDDGREKTIGSRTVWDELADVAMEAARAQATLEARCARARVTGGEIPPIALGIPSNRRHKQQPDRKSVV